MQMASYGDPRQFLQNKLNIMRAMVAVLHRSQKMLSQGVKLWVKGSVSENSLMLKKADFQAC